MFLACIAICIGQEASERVGKSEATILKIDQSLKFGSVEFGQKLSNDFKEITDETVLERRLHLLDEKLKWYRYNNSPNQVDGLNVDRVFYGFKEDLLVEIAIEFSLEKGYTGGKKALAFLEKNYTGQRYDGENWVWTGHSVGMNFTGFCTLETSSLNRLYIFPKSRAFIMPKKREIEML